MIITNYVNPQEHTGAFISMWFDGSAAAGMSYGGGVTLMQPSRAPLTSEVTSPFTHQTVVRRVHPSGDTDQTFTHLNRSELEMLPGSVGSLRF